MTKKKLYITTAIPYANGAPHIGNALDYLLADIWARYQKQLGNEVRFQVGTDEHGNKIAALLTQPDELLPDGLAALAAALAFGLFNHKHGIAVRGI